MHHLEAICAVRPTYGSLGAKGLHPTIYMDIIVKISATCERYPTNAHKQFLLCLLIPLHVSASRCHLQGVTVSLFISYSRLSAIRVGVGYCSSGVA
jgi:hypothetical protein